MKVEEVGKLLQGTFLNETNRSKEIGAIAIDSRTMRKKRCVSLSFGKNTRWTQFYKRCFIKKA